MQPLDNLSTSHEHHLVSIPRYLRAVDGTHPSRVDQVEIEKM